MLNLRATARNINLIILITKDREGWSVFRRCLINIDIGRLFFAHVQSAKVVPPTPSFVIRRSRFLSRFNAIFISRYIYMYIASNEERPFSFFLQIIHTDRWTDREIRIIEFNYKRFNLCFIQI